MILAGPEPGARSGKPDINRMSYGTAYPTPKQYFLKIGQMEHYHMERRIPLRKDSRLKKGTRLSPKLSNGRNGVMLQFTGCS
jgi:hypothetical protein